MENQIKKLREEFNKKLDKLESKISKRSNKLKWTKIGNLEWSECLGVMNWHDAVKKCKKLGGRLPTRVELLDLLDNHKKECKDFADGYYWSSTEHSESYAWDQSFTTGFQYNGDKTNSYYVRCVRG